MALPELDATPVPHPLEFGSSQLARALIGVRRDTHGADHYSARGCFGPVSKWSIAFYLLRAASRLYKRNPRPEPNVNAH